MKFFLFRIEVLMPDGAWLSFLLTAPSNEEINRMVRLAYPEGKDFKVYQIDPF